MTINPQRNLCARIGASSLIATALVLSCTVPDDPGEDPTGGVGGAGAPAGGTGATGGASGAGGSTTGGTGGTGGMGGAGGTGGVGGAGGAMGGTGGAASGAGGSVAGVGGAMSGAGGATMRGGSGGQATGGASGSAGGGGKAASGGNGGAGAQSGGAGTGGSTAGSGGSGGTTPSSGCGKMPPASSRYSMDVSGTMREYILYVPSGYDPMKPYRLVFAWHPLGGSAQQTAGNGNGGYYGLQGASQGQAILVSGEGLGQNGGTGNKGWWNSGGGDIAFLRAMLERFKAEMCIDEGRIFHTGFSFGGMMSFAAGCAGLGRAIAPMAGNSQVSGCTMGSQPVAVMGFHGVNDSVVAISGGRTARDVFVDRNQCTETTMPTVPSWCDGINQNQQPCSCVSYQGCTAGYPVTWCEFNADHTPAPNSAATLWSFFSQF
jgi:poly(3-hydroxybutyrate) depolymerase